MSTTISADKMLRIMDVMRRNPNSLRPVASTTKRSTDPVRMLAFTEVVKSGVPLVFTATVGDQEIRLHLLDGYADSENPGASIVAPYNAALKALGNKAVLDVNAPFREIARAHSAIYARITVGNLPVADGTKLVSAKAQPSKADQRKVQQKPNPAAKAAPTPKEAKPVVTTEKKAAEPLARPYVWVKNGVEQRITTKQWEQRVRMCGGLDRVPLGSGEVGDPFQMQVLTDDEAETVDIEWVDDIPVVVDINPESPALVVIQKPSSQAKAKRTKRTKAQKAKATAAQPDLARALAFIK